MAVDPGAPASTEQKPEEKSEEVKPDESKLGDAGKAALDAERSARAAAEKEAKAAKAELEELRKANMSEQEKAVAEAKEAGKAEALTVANARLLKSEAKAAAGGKLADPSDAPALLGDLDRFLKDDEIDTKAMASAIDALVKAKPYLAPSGRPGPLPGGGAKPSAGQSMDDWLRSQASARGRV